MARTAQVDRFQTTSDEAVRFGAFAARSPVWLYPQVLSLDAPAVAVCWQWLFAKTFHVSIGPAALLVTAACVWMIYAADHLLDVRGGAIYSVRHRFLARHSRSFLGAAVAVFIAATLASARLPLSIWRGAVELTAIVGVYLALVHCGGEKVRRYWPKEFAIGAVFAAGSTIATWSSGARHVWPEIALFAASCTLNCCAVDYWEWQTNHVLLRYPHGLTRWVGRRFATCAVAIIAVGGLLLAFAPSEVIGAVIASMLLLLFVARKRGRISPEVAHLLADAALLTPLLFLLR